MRNVAIGLATALVLAILIVVRHGGGLAALAGSGENSYTFISTQPGQPTVPVTYSSCKRIPVEFNLDGVEDRATTREILLVAMGEASAASHLNLVYVGSSTRRPRPGGATLEGYPVLIAFADPAEHPSLEGNAGEGGSAWIERDGVSIYVSGQIVLEKGYWNRNLDGWHGKEIARAIVMHELGHVLGLGHVDDDNEIMSKSGSGMYEYGPGDLHGLARLGQGPCV